MPLSKVNLAVAAALIGFVVTVSQANAAYIVNVRQVGSDVVATGGGTINTAGLSLLGPSGGGGVFNARYGIVFVGSSGPVTAFEGSTGPVSFGSGGGISASSNSGDAVGVYGLSNAVYVPTGYVSETPLSDTSTWAGTTINDLGVIQGTYTWTWGSGGTADSFTMYVPEPASITILGIPAAMALLRRRRRAG